MWMWRRMLKISWTEKVTNEEVLVHAVKLGAYSKRFSTRSTDALDIFSGIRTFPMTALKKK